MNMKNILIQRRRFFPIALVVLLIVFLEGGSYLTLKCIEYEFYRVGASGNLISGGTNYTQQEIASYFAERDPVLGWPTLSALRSPAYDSSKARPDPDFPPTEEPCAAAFGDSFTYSAEVDDKFAWTHRLSEMLGCRVANYGVGAYGTDQAYLRFKQTNIGSANLVILGIFPDNIMRIVNQYRGFLVGRHDIRGFKPRFVVEHGKLVEVPIINQPDTKFNHIVEIPEKYLPHEYFLPGSKYGPVQIKFPYSFSVVRALFHPRALAVIGGEPSWLDFYKPGHDSGAFEVMTALIENFVQDVRDLHKTPLIYMFTNASSVEMHQKTGKWPYGTCWNI